MINIFTTAKHLFNIMISILYNCNCSPVVSHPTVFSKALEQIPENAFKQYLKLLQLEQSTDCLIIVKLSNKGQTETHDTTHVMQYYAC